MWYACSMNKDRFNRVHDAFKAISESARYLNCVANDLHRVGQKFLADRIEEEVADLKEALKTLRHADAEAVTEDLHIAHETSNNILRAALTGLELAERNHEE